MSNAKQTVVFLSVFLTLLVMSTLPFRYFKNKVYSDSNFKIAEEIKVIVCGDSHVQNACDPNVISFSSNWAVGAENMLVTECKIRKILALNSNVEVIVLGFGCHNLLETRMTQFNESDVLFNRYFPILYDYAEGRKLLKVDQKKFLRGYFNYVMCIPLEAERMLRDVYKTKEKPFKQNFGARTNQVVTTAMIESRIQDLFYEKNRLVMRSVELEQSLERIILIAQKDNVEVVLLNTPIYPSYGECIPNNILQNYYDYVSMLTNRFSNAYFLNYSNFLSAAPDFADTDHVSKQGSKKVSLEINSYLINILE